MRLQRLVMPDGSVSWTVLDDRGEVIAPAEAFLAHLQALGRSETVRTYATSLKLWWEFLGGVGCGFDAATVDHVVRFVSWLRAPAENVAVLEGGSGAAGAAAPPGAAHAHRRPAAGDRGGVRAPAGPERCPFLGRTGNMTKEHAWPRWLGQGEQVEPTHTTRSIGFGRTADDAIAPARSRPQGAPPSTSGSCAASPTSPARLGAIDAATR